MLRRAWWLVCVWAVVSLAPAAAAAPPASSGTPACVDWTVAARDIPTEPFTRSRPNRHYVISNESYLHVFRPLIKAGGLHIGVGTDQNYVMAGWFRPRYIAIIDYDPVVIDVHKVYQAFFEGADDLRSFRRLWHKKSVNKALRLINKRWDSNETTLRQVRDAYKKYRWKVAARLKTLSRWGEEDPAKRNFATDPEAYRYLRDLVRDGRFVAVRGDLRGKKTMQGIAWAAIRAEVSVRTLYLSNAEGYFRVYDPGFRPNILAMPFDASTLILRTKPAREGLLAYYVQKGLDFQRWMAAGIKGIAPLLKKGRKMLGPHAHSRLGVIDALPKGTQHLDLPSVCRKLARK